MSDRTSALKLMDVSRETITLLDEYERLLRIWAPVTNLVGPSAMGALWSRHFIDSLQVASMAPQANVWIDLGTGAGFPGLVIAISLQAKPSARVHLIEPDKRKCAFLREVVRATGVHATVHPHRAEDVIGSISDVDIVTSRAMAPLDRLVAIAYDKLLSGATALFPKGQGFRAEVDAMAMADFRIDTIQSITDPAAAIVRVQRRSGNGSDA